MARTEINAADLEVILTSTGYVALSAIPTDGTDLSDLFCATGPLAPQPLSALVQDMLRDLQAVSSPEDAEELAQLEAEFRLCLSLIVQAINAPKPA